MKNRKLKPDTVLKDYWRNNDRFADLFNQVFFHGEKQIVPQKLSDKDTEESSIIMEKDRTITSLSRADEFLSGLTLSDKLKPALTLVIYYGEKPWNGPVSLNDMMDIPKAYYPFFNNYNIHLLQVRSTGQYKFQNQDNKDFFILMKEFYENEGKLDIGLFKKKYPDLNIHWETLAALGAAAGSMELVNYALKKEGGKIHMCTALDNLKKEGIQEGIQKGIQKGIRIVVETYRDLEYPDEVIPSKLKEKFDLTNDEAKAYL